MGASGVRLSVPPGYSAELVGGVSVAVAGRYRGSVYAGGGGGKPPSCCQPAVGTSEPGRNGVWALKTSPYEVYGFALKSAGCGKGGGSGGREDDARRGGGGRRGRRTHARTVSRPLLLDCFIRS